MFKSKENHFYFFYPTMFNDIIFFIQYIIRIFDENIIMEEYIIYNGKRFKKVPISNVDYCSEDGLVYSSFKNGLKNRRLFNNYWQYNIGDRSLFAHQIVAITYLDHVLDGGKKTHVDHIDGNKQNNHVDNLRVVTARDNIGRGRGKTSSLTGVCWSKQNKNWVAHIRIDGRLMYLGSYEDEIDAGIAYRNAKAKLP